jgi:hypothetical protein
MAACFLILAPIDGDIVLPGEWRTLASIQAANGVIMFGWTTALIFYFIQKIYKND